MSNRLTLLSRRISRLRLKQKDLAALSGLDETTLSRTFRGRTDPLNSTLDRIEAAVAQEESRLRDDLGANLNGDAA